MMKMSMMPRQLKVIVLGDSGVGKTSILARFANNEFSSNYQATIGADFLFKELIVDGTKFILQIWDTAGQERHNSLGGLYYRGTDCCVLVFDITNIESFYNAVKWKLDFLIKSGNNQESTQLILVGNKRDLESNRAVDSSTAKTWAQKEGLIYCEVSAKENIHIEDVFANACRMCIMNKSIYTDKRINVNPIVLSSFNQKSNKRKCCG